ncbi:MAG: hypothetical protein GYB33_00515 [Gammaproteobacteria bacterium]|nr:hypothetical protein [Gammaproteobacteria bacterium]
MNMKLSIKVSSLIASLIVVTACTVLPKANDSSVDALKGSALSFNQIVT